MSTVTPAKEDLMQEQIIQAAKRLFQLHGFHKVTMDDVAKFIGKGRSSIYYYYKNKNEIFDAVMNLEIGDMLNAISQAVMQETTVEQKISAFCIAKLQILRERRSFYKALEAGMDADAMSHFKKAQIVHHNYIMKKEGALLSQVLTGGIESGELRDMGESDREVLIFVLLSAVHGLKREMVMENNFDGIVPSARKLAQMAVHGLKK